MAKILCTGIATLDIINEVQSYPSEDDEIRIISHQKRRGGNATNTAIILSQLGHQCYWAGTLAHEVDNKIILDDLSKHKVSFEYCQFLPQGKVPTSYITLSRTTGSRTITHYRDLPEYTFQAFKEINLSSFDWLHFEGRNIAETLKMMAYCKQQYPQKPISVEIEKPRKHCEMLLKDANIILFSKHYAMTQKFVSAQEFCQSKNAQYPNKVLICAWGKDGAAAAAQQQSYWQKALSVNVVDTLAAGDVFNAAMIDQHIQKINLAQCLEYACQLAGEKCSKNGITIL